VYIEEALTAAYHRACPPPTRHTDTLAPQRLCELLCQHSRCGERLRRCRLAEEVTRRRVDAGLVE